MRGRGDSSGEGRGDERDGGEAVGGEQVGVRERKSVEQCTALLVGNDRIEDKFALLEAGSGAGNGRGRSGGDGEGGGCHGRCAVRSSTSRVILSDSLPYSHSPRYTVEDELASLKKGMLKGTALSLQCLHPSPQPLHSSN